MWWYLAEEQAKVTGSYWHRYWGTKEATVPQYHAEHLQALRFAVWLFDLGRDKEWRREFARRLSQERAMIYPWFRRLVLELKGVRPPGSLIAAVSLTSSGSNESRRVFVFLSLLSSVQCRKSSRGSFIIPDLRWVGVRLISDRRSLA